ncbi:MAG: hypothetical protein R6V08_12200 [Desulfuromonadales bacterium]
MKKKIVTLIAMSMFIAGTSGAAFAGSKEVSGKVDEVLGNKITVEIKNGMAKDFSVGDKVEIEIEKKAKKKEKKEEKPDSNGMDMLQGC